MMFCLCNLSPFKTNLGSRLHEAPSLLYLFASEEMCSRTLRTLSRHLGLTTLPRLRCTPGETSIQGWRASYGNMDVVSFPYGRP